MGWSKKIIKNNAEKLKKNKYQKIFGRKDVFNKEINNNKNFIFKSKKIINNDQWIDNFFNNQNNFSNLNYINKKKIILRTSRISKNKINSNFLYKNGNIIFSDSKGIIYFYEVNKKKIYKFNFYKKTNKKFKKNVFLGVVENYVIVSDNLGYIYCIDLYKKKLIWAKNFGIPFRSNLKILNDVLYIANEENKLYAINIKSGEKIWDYGTEVTLLKTDYQNNLVIGKDNNILFLNTNGTLYNLNLLNRRLNWIINYRNTQKNSSNLFYSLPLIVDDNNFFVSTDGSFSSHELLSGFRNWEIPVDLSFLPIISGNTIYSLTKNKLLICIDRSNGKIIWSKSISTILKNSSFKKLDAKVGRINNIYMLKNKLFLFSYNGYILEIDPKTHRLIDAIKIKSKFDVRPIVVESHIYAINNKNNLLKIN